MNLRVKTVSSNLKYILLFFLILSTSCSTVKNKSSYRQNIIDSFRKGSLDEAKKNFTTETGKQINPNEKLIWNFEKGSIYFYLGDYDKSLLSLNKVEKIIEQHQKNILNYKPYDIRNKKIYPYNVTINDRIMLNIYQALDYFAMNKTDKGFDKIQSASDIQSKALSNFKNALEVENISIAKQNKNNKAIVTFNSLLSNKDIKNSYDDSYNNINIIYNDFSNPLLNYLSTIGYLYKNDFKSAYSELNKIYSMNDQNMYINKDIITLSKIIRTTPDKEISNTKPYKYSLSNNIVFIIFAKGFAPSLVAKKTELALPRVGYIRFLYPELYFYKCSVNSLDVYTSDQQHFRTETIADNSSIIAYEFSKKFPIYITKKAVLTVTKEKNTNYENSIEEYVKGNIYGIFNTALIGISRYALNEADIRCWETLPEEFQIAQLEMPKDGILYIKLLAEDIDTKTRKIKLNVKNKITILYVRSISPTNLTVKVLKLN
jgi:uncharacterized protein